MKRIANTIGIASLLCFAVLPVAGFAADKSAPPVVTEGKTASNVDNSSMNGRDKNAANATAEDQSNSPADRKLLAAVRRSVVQDKSLSVTAHNIKILVEAGTVTLRGPVKTADEKTRIEKLAQAVPGVASVNNSLDVKSN
ncbi:BON domain-containing protein [Undibacterium sp. Di27W]|uniref:BON domain-containing protein n=1 Tax=Undibacterium sp. Di27W TaxID=3413036 RepID=UPI003BF33B16